MERGDPDSHQEHRLQPRLTSWGLNIERRVERLQETSRWAGATQDYEIYQTSRAGLLTDLPKFDVGLGLSIRPAFTTGGEKLGRTSPTAFTRDFSLDVTAEARRQPSELA